MWLMPKQINQYQNQTTLTQIFFLEVRVPFNSLKNIPNIVL